MFWVTPPQPSIQRFHLSHVGLHREHHVLRPLPLERHLMEWSLNSRFHSPPSSLKHPRPSKGRSCWQNNLQWKTLAIRHELHQIRVQRTVLQGHSSFSTSGLSNPSCSSGPSQVLLLRFLNTFSFHIQFYPLTYHCVCKWPGILNTAVLEWLAHMSHLFWTHQSSLHTLWHLTSYWVQKRAP